MSESKDIVDEYLRFLGPGELVRRSLVLVGVDLANGPDQTVVSRTGTLVAFKRRGETAMALRKNGERLAAVRKSALEAEKRERAAEAYFKWLEQ